MRCDVVLVMVALLISCVSQSAGGWGGGVGGGVFFFQAEDGIRDLVRSRGLGDVYKRQVEGQGDVRLHRPLARHGAPGDPRPPSGQHPRGDACLLYTSDAADERSSVDLGGRRIIKKKKASDIDATPDITCNVIITITAVR